MRIVVDLQGAQAENRERGIGKYSLALAVAIARNRGEHEVLIALNGMLAESIQPIRSAFANMLPPDNFRIWHGDPPVSYLDPANAWRRDSAELIREAFLASLSPDVVLIMSLFEGQVDNASTSIGMLHSNITTATVVYDLIPFVHPGLYLSNPATQSWYLNKLDHLQRADLWLTISESSRQECIDYLGISASKIFNISADVEPYFQPKKISSREERSVRESYGLTRKIVLYTGGIDHRKNLDGLIAAYALLPDSLRREHQLAIVCSARPEDLRALTILAEQSGLSEGELVMTGFVPVEDLLVLYNICRLFVFPSWHEGFGLPVLEAIRCGAPVIAANVTSLPELIGWSEALFDPHSREDMAKAIERGLTDEVYRGELVRRATVQAHEFSWDKSAIKTLHVLEGFKPGSNYLAGGNGLNIRRPRLAYVSPLPPERSGISEYSSELLAELSRHYKIDVIVDQKTISDQRVEACFNIRTCDWFKVNTERYDRILYHFGNSQFHQHMFELLASFPGVVVLHDFYLSGAVHYIGSCSGKTDYYAKELYYSHGYQALVDELTLHASDNTVWKYPSNRRVLVSAYGVIAHSQNSLDLARYWFSDLDEERWRVIPHLRDPRVENDREAAREKLGIDKEHLLVCAFGLLGPTKLNDRLLTAWENSKLAHRRDCQLIFVGEHDEGSYGLEFRKRLKTISCESNISVTGWVEKEQFRAYLAAADIGVQLRSRSRGETSGTVLDCMNYQMATIVNANGSMRYLPEDVAWKLPDEFTDQQLIKALEGLWSKPSERRKLGTSARSFIVNQHSPRKCARQYFSAVEKFYLRAGITAPALTSAIADLDTDQHENELRSISRAIAQSFPALPRDKQILVDVSELVHRDSESGIQRVVKNILRVFLHTEKEGIRFEPVYATTDEGYRYARRFTLDFINYPDLDMEDEPIEVSSGDIFLGLDLQPAVIKAQAPFYTFLRNQGVRVKFVVYDLLPILLPDTYIAGASAMHSDWLKVVGKSDGAICISQSVAEELISWLGCNMSQSERPIQIDWFHLGADTYHSTKTHGLPSDSTEVLNVLSSRPCFLMVGTIEPRKGYSDALAAFESLWSRGVDVNLAFVGKQGWLVEDFIDSLRNHPQLNKRLFWLEGISDEYLEKLFAVATCLIAASKGEGFGLPLIEAAQHKLPIIARDIPVFREVAGDYATYFKGDPADLALCIQSWLSHYREGTYISSEGMPWLTWEESGMQLLNILIQN